MQSYGFHELPPGTTFGLKTPEGVVELTSCGSSRRWLDVTLNGDKAILLCYYEPYRGDPEEFRLRMESLGGMLEAAATEIREGMTALVIYDGNNYMFTIDAVLLSS